MLGVSAGAAGRKGERRMPQKTLTPSGLETFWVWKFGVKEFGGFFLASTLRK